MGFLTRERVQARKDTYLLGHYMNLHSALLGVAIGVAGLAASNIFATPGQYANPTLQVMYLVASLLIVTNVYIGMMVGGLVLPSAAPTVFDFILPLLIGLAEFLQFWFLALEQKTPEIPSAVNSGWSLSFSTLSILAFCAIRRAKLHIKDDRYEASLRTMIHEYRRRLWADEIGALISAALGATIYLFHRMHVWIWLHYAIPSATIFCLTLGIWSQQKTADRIAHHLGDTR